jgi:ubiquitin carboxyl-terminal hydrolase L5
MARYSSSETHFALLSVCESKTSIIEAEINNLNQEISTSIDETFINMSQQNLQLLQEELGDENEKLKRQLKENVRRRHNYIPLIISLIRSLASENKLEDMVRRSNYFANH